MFLLSGRWVQYSVHSGFQRGFQHCTAIPDSPLRVLSWPRGPRARAPGGSLHTGAIFKALSAGGVCGSTLYNNALCLPMATPKLLPQGGSSPLESSALLHRLEVVPARFLPMATPKILPQSGSSPLESSALLHSFEVVQNIPKVHKTRLFPINAP